MGYLCRGQCWVTVRGCPLRSFALMGYLCRGQCWVTGRSGSLRSCAAVNVESQCVVARFARRHITDICAADSVGSQYVVARFARKHLKGVCAAVSVGVAARSGSRVLVLLLLVFVHDYNRARRLGNCVLLLEPPRTTAIVVQYSRPHTSPFARGMVKLTFVPKCRVGQTWRNARKGRAIAVEER